MPPSIETLMVVPPPMFAPTPRNPMRPNVSTPSAGAVSVYFPLSSVTVLVADPRTRTVTPRRCSPVVDVTVPETSISWGCWAMAGARNTTAISTVLPTQRRKRLHCRMSFMAASSSCGSSHGLQALLSDQHALRLELYFAGLHGPGELLW